MALQSELPKSSPSALQYENVTMQSIDLPVNVNFKKSNAQSGGCELHWHEELEFYYVTKGGVSLLCNGKKEWLYPGDIGFVNWCEPHRGNGFLDGTEHYIIQIGTNLFADEMIGLSPSEQTSVQKENLLLILISQNNNLPKILRNCAELRELLDMIIQEIHKKQTGYEIKVKAAVLNILIFLLRNTDLSSNPNPIHTKDLSSLEHLKKVLAFLSFHYTDPDAVSLPALSARFGLSIPYLCRIFKKHTTLTLTAYVNELRCSCAASLIQDGLPLEEVASKTGFRDYNYFSRLFKKTVGITPSDYRKRTEKTISV